MKTKTVSGILLILLIFFSNSCKKNSTPASYNPPSITFTQSDTIAEDAPARSITLNFQLSAQSSRNITVHYSTEDSTALAGKDYEGVTDDSIVFIPGVVNKAITISIQPDTAQKHNTVFHVKFTDVSNATVQNADIRVVILNVDYATLAWSDEFSESQLNTNDWNYELGNNNGWGNSELETYTNSTNNVFINNGELNIKAIDEGGGNYSSGRITTQGKHEFTHGRIDIRAKLPKGQGLWPALWMLGSNISTVSWPACGEIDIMELLGQDTTRTYGTVHFSNGTSAAQSGGNMVLKEGFSSDFHVFSLIWTPTYLKWLVDNNVYYSVPKSSITGFPMDSPEFFIFNVAVGGNWPKNPDGTTVFPQTMTVDYIRVYQ